MEFGKTVWVKVNSWKRLLDAHQKKTACSHPRFGGAAHLFELNETGHSRSSSPGYGTERRFTNEGSFHLSQSETPTKPHGILGRLKGLFEKLRK